MYLGYKARFHETLSLDTGVRYFMRTDTESYGEIPEANTGEDANAESVFYGGEVYASVVWAPLDDITVMLGGGAFFPGWGNVFDSGTGPDWKITTGLILSF
jgi:hypothetical protein